MVLISLFLSLLILIVLSDNLVFNFAKFSIRLNISFFIKETDKKHSKRFKFLYIKINPQTDTIYLYFVYNIYIITYSQ